MADIQTEIDRIAGEFNLAGKTDDAYVLILNPLDTQSIANGNGHEIGVMFVDTEDCVLTEAGLVKGTTGGITVADVIQKQVLSQVRQATGLEARLI